MDDQTVSIPLERSYWQRKPNFPASSSWAKATGSPHRSSRAFLATWYRSPEKTVSSTAGLYRYIPTPRKLLVATTNSVPGSGSRTSIPWQLHSTTAIRPARSAKVRV